MIQSVHIISTHSFNEHSGIHEEISPIEFQELSFVFSFSSSPVLMICPATLFICTFFCDCSCFSSGLFFSELYLSFYSFIFFMINMYLFQKNTALRDNFFNYPANYSAHYSYYYSASLLSFSTSAA